ncbi:hypothetical protein ACWDDN_10765 [Streptomyces griseoruber]
MTAVRGVFVLSIVAISTTLLSACVGGGKSDESSRDQEVVRVTGRVKLVTAIEQAADAGEGFALRDATSIGRYIYLGKPEGYLVCFKKENLKMQAVELYAVPEVENCPTRLGAHMATPEVPKLIGDEVQESYVSAMMAGYAPKRLKVFNADDPDTAMDPKSVAQWEVCEQSPRTGEAFDPADEMRLQVAERCP